MGYIISDKLEINIEEHEIQPFDILHKTNLNFLHKTNLLNIYVIENNNILYSNDIINNASIFGHVQVLEWVKNCGYKFKYVYSAINYASENGQIQVLEWFKNSGYKFKYDEWTIFSASCYGHV